MTDGSPEDNVRDLKMRFRLEIGKQSKPPVGHQWLHQPMLVCFAEQRSAYRSPFSTRVFTLRLINSFDELD